MRSDALTFIDGMRHSTPEEKESMERFIEGKSVELIPRDQYDRLLDLALELYYFIGSVEAIGRWIFDSCECSCSDFCDHDTTEDGCTRTGVCWYARKFRELGVEVDE